MKYVIVLLVILGSQVSFSQSKKDVETLAKNPKRTVSFSVNDYMAFPRLTSEFWDHDYAVYKKFITPAMQRTQMGLAFEREGIQTWMVGNSTIPHAQLDTATMLKNTEQVKGKWRMISFRSLKFEDSVIIATQDFFRHEALLNDLSTSEDCIAIFTEENFKLFARSKGQTKFKQKTSSRYSVENNRSLLIYKFKKSASVVVQIGITQEGYLILQFPTVIERKKPNVYIVYNTIVEQFIFEPIKE